MLIPLKTKMDPKVSLLDHVIEDCRKKGAPILKWETSVNGRIVLCMSERLPHYFFNHICAIDFLIHSYNLKPDYRYLYNTPKKPNSVPKYDIGPLDLDKDKKALEKKLISNTQRLLGKESRVFTQKDELLILSAINRTFGWHNVNHTILDEALEILQAHYTNKLAKAENQYHTNFLRKLINFLQNLTFTHFSEYS